MVYKVYAAPAPLNVVLNGQPASLLGFKNHRIPFTVYLDGAVWILHRAGRPDQIVAELPHLLLIGSRVALDPGNVIIPNQLGYGLHVVSV